ncbi:MAG: Eco57I restriction-modification methylase domain-containing protein [Acidobacteriota bacterium]|nr:Eco57I restriction-modification methylase domain-containing protein [Acidobacteriota bacterium]
MNQEQAREHIKKTFESDFDRKRFGEFIAQMLKSVDFSNEFQLSGSRVRQAFQDKVISYERIGTYTDINGEKIDVLIVNLRRKELLERARKGLRNFVADYLQSERGFDKSAVLAAYAVKGDDGNYLAQTGWRFSYVTLEKDLRQNDKGKFKEEIVHITPARRYSFRVGDSEETNTAQNRFFTLLKSQSSPTLAQIEEAFSIDKLNKDFYDSYEQLLQKVSDALIKVRKENKNLDAHWKEKFFEDEDVTNDAHDPHKKTKDFAKKLLGQIIFLYFLQRKGWLGVKRNEHYGGGDRNFLKNIFDNRKNDYQNYAPFRNRTNSFFNDVLKHIFYDALAVEHTKDIFSNSDLRFPFLNGGLFEAKFDWNEYDIPLPDEVFSNQEKKGEESGSGIFDVFDRFNFTANESEPSEIEVAIDPEMLGRVFENQLLKEERGSKGTFYTPRVIVNYMCRESLLNYLSTHFTDKSLKKRPAHLKSETNEIRQLKIGETGNKIVAAAPTFDELKNFISFADSSFDYQQGGANVDEKKMFPPSIVGNAAEIDWLLQDVKICDPAIGSGAFPVGLLQEIVRLREAIAPLINDKQNEDDEFSLIYQLKLHAIQNSIYGVDIETSAVDIARLRLWLSLIVDEQKREKIRTLPNLDYKIMQGNSLLEEFGGVRLIPDDIFKRRPQTVETEASEEEIFLEQLRAELFAARKAEGNNSTKALKLMRDFDQLDKAIKNRKKDSAPKLTDERFFEQSRNQEYFGEIERVHREFFEAQSESLKKRLRIDLEIAILRYVNNYLNERDTHYASLIENYKAEIASQERNIKRTLKKDIETKSLKDLRRDLQIAKTALEQLNETRVELKKLWLIDNEQNADKDLANINRKNITEAQTKPFFLWEIQFLEVFRDNGGFDIVIANPPYVRAERITKYKDALKRAFPEVFAGTADILVYFYARGWNILRDKGTLAFITSNKYFRANYGEGLRRFLGNQTRILQIIDFGDAPVFEAAAYASIIVLQKEKAKANQTQVWTFPQNETISDFEEGFRQLGFAVPQKELKGEGWRLENAETLRLFEKLRSCKTTLSEYVNEEFYRGIITGLNEAFVVDEKTKNDLIAEDESSREILKPFLRGRDVKRWITKFENQYLIKIESSSNVEHPWSGKKLEHAEEIFAKTYPAIYNRFNSSEFRSQLIKRDDQGNYFWELRACAYWDKFEKTKIFYPDIYAHQSFAWDEKGYLSGNTCYFIPISDKWLFALLNSITIEWFYSQISNKIRGGYLRAFTDYMKQIPIPNAEDWQKEIIEKFVEYILFLKKNTESPTAAPLFENKSNTFVKDASIIVSYFEAIIDGLVYELFLPDELREAGKEFFAFLKKVKLSALDGSNNEQIIRTVYQTLHAENHPVRQNLFLLDSIESVRIILGKEK